MPLANFISQVVAASAATANSEVVDAAVLEVGAERVVSIEAVGAADVRTIGAMAKDWVWVVEIQPLRWNFSRIVGLGEAGSLQDWRPFVVYL